MTRAVVSIAVLCVGVLVADAVMEPQSASSRKLQAAACASSASALEMESITIPQMLSYQGRLTDTFGLPVADTTYSVTFGLYTQPTGGSPFWHETQTVVTRGGVFSTLLGSVTPIGSMPDAGVAYLGMAVGWDLELAPRLRIASAAYAYLSERSENADLLQGKDTTGFVQAGQANSVTSTMIVNGTVAAADIADTNVTMAKIARAGASTGQVVKWTGAAWAPGNDSVGGGSIPDSIPGSLAIGGELRVYSKARLGYSCYNSGNAAFCAGYGNNADGDRSSITGGEDNTADGDYSHVGGGSENRADALWSTIGGGNVNEATDTAATVGGGRNNLATASHAAVAGGYGNDATGAYSFIGGGYNNAADTIYTTVGGGYNNDATGAYSFVGGGYNNVADTVFATVGGGLNNEATEYAATVGGGNSNEATGNHSTVGGGSSNNATGAHSFIGGGYNNAADSLYATVGGGRDNGATGRAATVGGGYGNAAETSYATVAGGLYNDATGYGATVGGGYRSSASGAGSFAAGIYAKARGDGSFVWSDECGADDSVRTSTDNRWVARARGGVYFYTNLGMTTGSYLSAGGSSWNSVSDSMTKENFRPVDKQALLEALAQMRVRDYNLKSQDASIRHIGPVAQDFHSAFGFGESNTAINMEDADGVALAAIQALYEQNQTLNRRVAELEARIAGQK